MRLRITFTDFTGRERGPFDDHGKLNSAVHAIHVQVSDVRPLVEAFARALAEEERRAATTK